MRVRTRPAFPRINSSSPLAKGLVFAGLGGGAGTSTMYDASWYGNHGTLTNMDATTDWVWDTTLNRFVLDFDGSDDAIVGRTNWSQVKFAAGEPFTVCCFAKPRRVNGTWQTVVQYSRSVPTYWGIWLSGSNCWALGDSGGNIEAHNLEGPVAASQEVWAHVCCLRLPVLGRNLFINGSLLASDANTTQTTGTGTFAIASSLAIGELFSGSVSDVLVYSRAIKESEIQSLADPSNTYLRCGGTDLILPPKRRAFAAVTVAPEPPQTIYRHRCGMNGGFASLTGGLA